MKPIQSRTQFFSDAQVIATRSPGIVFVHDAAAPVSSSSAISRYITVTREEEGFAVSLLENDCRKDGSDQEMITIYVEVKAGIAPWVNFLVLFTI